MWDKDDHFTRWVHGICGFVFLLIGYCFIGQLPIWYQATHVTYWAGHYWLVGPFALFIAYKCFVYAFTGEGNINERD